MCAVKRHAENFVLELKYFEICVVVVVVVVGVDVNDVINGVCAQQLGGSTTKFHELGQIFAFDLVLCINYWRNMFCIGKCF